MPAFQPGLRNAVGRACWDLTKAVALKLRVIVKASGKVTQQADLQVIQ